MPTLDVPPIQSASTLMPPDYDLSKPHIAKYFCKSVHSLATISTLTSTERSLMMFERAQKIMREEVVAEMSRTPLLRTISENPNRVIREARLNTIRGRRDETAHTISEANRRIASYIYNNINQLCNSAEPAGRSTPTSFADLHRNLMDIRHMERGTYAVHPDKVVLDFPDVWFDAANKGKTNFRMGYYRCVLSLPIGMSMCGYSFTLDMVSGDKARSGVVHTNGRGGNNYCMGRVFDQNITTLLPLGQIPAIYDLIHGYLTTWNPLDCIQNRTYWFIKAASHSTQEPDHLSINPVYRPFPNYQIPLRHEGTGLPLDLDPQVWRTPTTTRAITIGVGVRFPQRLSPFGPALLAKLALPIIRRTTEGVEPLITDINTSIHFFPQLRGQVLAILSRTLSREPPQPQAQPQPPLPPPQPVPGLRGVPTPTPYVPMEEPTRGTTVQQQLNNTAGRAGGATLRPVRPFQPLIDDPGEYHPAPTGVWITRTLDF